MFKTLFWIHLNDNIHQKASNHSEGQNKWAGEGSKCVSASCSAKYSHAEKKSFCLVLQKTQQVVVYLPVNPRKKRLSSLPLSSVCHRSCGSFTIGGVTNPLTAAPPSVGGIWCSRKTSNKWFWRLHKRTRLLRNAIFSSRWRRACVPLLPLSWAMTFLSG